MKGEEIALARVTLGLRTHELGAMLGFQGTQRVQRISVWRLESDRRYITEPQRRLLQAYLAGYRPEDWPEDST